MHSSQLLKFCSFTFTRHASLHWIRCFALSLYVSPDPNQLCIDYPLMPHGISRGLILPWFGLGCWHKNLIYKPAVSKHPYSIATHLGRYKMSHIFQTTFSNGFSLIKNGWISNTILSFVLYRMVQLTIIQNCSDNGLKLDRRQTITWTNECCVFFIKTTNSITIGSKRDIGLC